MGVGLEVNTNVKLLGCMVKVFHSGLGTPHYHLEGGEVSTDRMCVGATKVCACLCVLTFMVSSR